MRRSSLRQLVLCGNARRKSKQAAKFCRTGSVGSFPAPQQLRRRYEYFRVRREGRAESLPAPPQISLPPATISTVKRSLNMSSSGLPHVDLMMSNLTESHEKLNLGPRPMASITPEHILDSWRELQNPEIVEVDELDEIFGEVYAFVISLSVSSRCINLLLSVLLYSHNFCRSLSTLSVGSDHLPSHPSLDRVRVSFYHPVMSFYSFFLLIHLPVCIHLLIFCSTPTVSPLNVPAPPTPDQQPTYASVLQRPGPSLPQPTSKIYQPLSSSPQRSFTIEDLYRRRFHNKPSPFQLNKKTSKSSARRARN